MARPVSVLPLLLLLLTCVVAHGYDYQQLADVSIPAASIALYTDSDSDCAGHCDADQQCYGYLYNNETCRLYHRDCRGPGAGISRVADADRMEPAPDNYSAKNICPGTARNRCGCPGEFLRYGSRCLLLLGQEMEFADAVQRCTDLGAHLAVPRSPAENDMVQLAAAHVRAGPLTNAWLGMYQHGSDVWLGLDGCGAIQHYFWAEGQSSYSDPTVAYAPPGLTDTADGWHTAPEQDSTGWHTLGYDGPPYRPLCQLALCYRPDCQPHGSATGTFS